MVTQRFSKVEANQNTAFDKRIVSEQKHKRAKPFGWTSAFKNFLFPKIDFKRDIIRAKIWFPYGKRLLANNMTGQADVRLCKLGGGWRLVK